MAVSLFAADKLPAPKLLDLARHKPHSSEFRDALTASLGQEKIQKGTAAIGEGPNFLWAVESKTPPQLVIDDGAPLKMKRLPKADLWFALGTLETGRSHAYHYLVNGAKFGGDQNLPAFLPEAYSHPGVPQGKLSDRLTMTSKIYDGMTTEYWIYVPVEYDANTPAALMVWQDGQSQIDRDGPTHTLNTLDNLISEKKIPVMISVFIRPGSTGKKRRTCGASNTTLCPIVIHDSCAKSFCRWSKRNTTSAKMRIATASPGFHRAASAPSMRPGSCRISSLAFGPESAASPPFSGNPARRSAATTIHS